MFNFGNELYWKRYLKILDQKSAFRFSSLSLLFLSYFQLTDCSYCYYFLRTRSEASSFTYVLRDMNKAFGPSASYQRGYNYQSSLREANIFVQEVSTLYVRALSSKNVKVNFIFRKIFLKKEKKIILMEEIFAKKIFV